MVSTLSTTPGTWPSFLDTPPPLVQRFSLGQQRLFREVTIPLHRDDAFRRWWKANGTTMIRAGWWVAEFNGAQRLNQWLQLDGSLTPTSLEKVRRLDERLQMSLPLEEAPLTLEPLPDGLEEKLFGYQVMPARQLWRALTHGEKEWGYSGAVDLSDMGCHAKGQLILMADGTTKSVEDITIGDSVMGWRGPQTVTELKRGRSEMARIIPIKGEPFVVNLAHILTLQFTNEAPSRNSKTSGQIIDISVSEFLKLPTSTRDKLKLFRQPVGCWPEQDLPLDPYFLGIFLGDGCSRHNTPTTLSISKPDIEIEQEVIHQAAAWGCGYTKRLRKANNPAHCILSARPISNELSKLGLYGLKSKDKFIPHPYLTASTRQRLEMLAGLLDTDGHMSKGGFDFISASEKLASGVCFLARSLGFAAYMKPSERGCQNGFTGSYWRISISGDCDLIPTRIPRKQAPVRRQSKSVLRTGFRVEPMPEDDFYGFSLSGDGRFLLGDFTVTHNTGKTYQSLAAALATGKSVIVLCPVVGRGGWERAFQHFGAEPHFIGTYEGIRSGNRPGIVEEIGDKEKVFRWKNAKDVILIMDEAQAVRHDDSLTFRCCVGAITQKIPIIIASATVAINPIEMRFAGRIAGLHRGGDDWTRFLVQHGCSRAFAGGNWKWDGQSHHLAKINSRLFPHRGCRVRKEELGSECPETEITVLPIKCKESAQIEAEWKQTQYLLEQMAQQGKYTEAIARRMRMRTWQRAEMALVPHVAARAKADAAAGRSVAIFVSFTKTRTDLCRLLKTQAGFYGGQTLQRRKYWEAEFQANREHFLISNIGAGGASVSLHDLTGERPRTSYIFPTDHVVQMEQATGRVDRVGGKSKSLQFIPCVAGTLSEKMVERTRRKMLNVATLNDGVDAKSRI